MKVPAVIEPACADTAKRRPAVVRQILDHRGLSTAAPSLRAPPDPPEGPEAAPPREWSYEPLGWALGLSAGRRLATKPFYDDRAVPDPLMA